MPLRSLVQEQERRLPQDLGCDGFAGSSELSIRESRCIVSGKADQTNQASTQTNAKSARGGS